MKVLSGTLWVVISGAFIGLLIAWLGMALNNPLSVRLNLHAPGAAAELFYEIDEQGLHPTRRERWRQPEEGEKSVFYRFHTIAPISLIRIDPTTESGQPIRLGAVEIRTPWSRWQLSGESLQAAIGHHQQLVFEGITRDSLRLTTSGTDPQITLAMPDGVTDRPLARQLAWLSTGMLAGALLAVLVLIMRRVLPPRWQAGHGQLFMILACALLTAQSWPLITERPIYGDGVQNANTTYNLWQYGVFSHEADDPPTPGNWREPLPEFVAAGYLALTLGDGADLTREGLSHGEQAIILKRGHLLWVFLGLIGVWTLTRRLTGSDIAGMLASGLAWLYFFGYPGRIDTFYTELQSAVLLIWVAVALHGVALRRTIGWAVAAGVLIGLLVLTKAMAFYVAIAAIPLVMLTLWRDRSRPSAATKHRSRSALVLGLAVTLAASAVTLPWVARNMLLLDAAAISDRGGLILYGRSVLNHMNAEEVTGVFYIHGPQFYQRQVTGTALGMQPGDMERGGRWQRLNRGVSSFSADDLEAQAKGRRQDAISFHRQVSAEYIRRIRLYRDAGHPQPRAAAGDSMQQEAISDIRAHPVRHLAMSVPFLWRGFWSIPAADWPVLTVSRQLQIREFINLGAGVSLLGAFLWGLVRGRASVVAWTIMAAGIIAAYATLTHNIPRYLAPTHPLMIIALVAVFWGIPGALARMIPRLRSS